MKKGSVILSICMIFLILTNLSNSQAQDSKTLIRELANEDRSVIDALVLYPEDIRMSIFELSKTPELVIRVDGLQSKTLQAFKELIEQYNRETQEDIYELIRYEGLVRELAESDGSPGDVESILSNYPESVSDLGKEYASKYQGILESLTGLDNTTREAFESLISEYPVTTQDAIKKLVELPEILTLMADNITLTVLLGDIYADDPGWVVNKADSLNLSIARQNAEELEDYQKQLEEDPEAYEEMVDAAEQYAKDNNIDLSAPVEKEVVTQTVVYHYPYWYGYPYWYTTPIWAPVPWYYHTGFYFGPGGGVVFIGFPSSFYIGWHYSYYPNRYYHLNYHYCRHYYRYPYSRNSFHTSVNINVVKNTTVKVNRDQIKNTNYNKGISTLDQKTRDQLTRENLVRDNSISKGNLDTRDTKAGFEQTIRDNRAKPSTRDKQVNPAVQPGDYKSRPQQRPAGETRPTQPDISRPQAKPAQPQTRPTGPSTYPSRGNTYQQFNGNQIHKQNWNTPSQGGSYSRPSSPQIQQRPATPVQRPTAPKTRQR